MKNEKYTEIFTREYKKVGSQTYEHLKPKPQSNFVDRTMELGYFRYDEKDFIKYNNDGSVEIVHLHDIKNEIIDSLKYVENLNDIDYDNIRTEIITNSNRIYNNHFIDYVKFKKFDGLKDTANISYLVFNDKIIEIKKNEILAHESCAKTYWKHAKINRNFIKTDQHSEFEKYCRLITAKDEARFDSIKSVIGYIISNYKSASYSPAVIMMDEGDNPNPKGRNGKGLFVKVLAQYSRRFLIDGKKLDHLDKFAYQEYDPTMNFIHIDDIKKCNIETFFSEITEGFTYEQKGKMKVRVSYENSPKYIITTNHLLEGMGASSSDRMFELEVHPYFSPEYRPEQEFGHAFISDWSVEEWSRLDNFIIECIQFYLMNGLVKQKNNEDFDLKKLRGNTTSDFPEWAEDNLNFPGKNLWFSEISLKWKSFKPKSGVSERKLFTWCREYFKYKNYTIIDDGKKPSNNSGKTDRKFIVSDPNQLAPVEYNIFSDVDKHRVIF